MKEKSDPILSMSKSEFKSQLSDTINKGETLFRKEISDKESFDNFEEEYKLWDNYNSQFLSNAFNDAFNTYSSTYYSIEVSSLNYTRYNRPSPDKLKKILLQKKLANLNFILAKAHMIKTKHEPVNSKKLTDNKSKVFIVHGHDEEAKTKTARFVEKLGFEAIILHEQASSSMSIIEKIEEYSNVGFGIVLYTPCDIGSKQIENPELKSRARQNVVFEHGFLIGKIKRENVCALVKGDVELPNDISGVVYIQLDNADSWKYTIAKEMKASGYDIDMNKI
ncbi:TIR domain-containing protein [Winogradskyella helgolandensis]|uniref:TIR domain-containing protein n=1 Tax=Winogradskyella helgolandensis TaxID=2697010 RepID=UPI001E62103A|nr:nucleotide-binding protein [Winogradskyella helgolandensis]